MNTTLPAIPAIMTVSKSCAAKGISKGERARDIPVTFVPEYGYQVTFKILGRFYVRWAARLQEGKFSLNTGDPTKRVVLEA